ncbi:AAA family ATPase, partial [Candidatus Dojkabacteria bacterium]|nr:AAA family ATPase [Candidatus Dojkabacteria bacterium]
FIDEIDAVAKKRGTVLHSAGGEQTLNQILVEMDGLETRENVIVLAATNRPDVLDPAILRPGRFDRTVTVQMPDYEGRLAILRVHAKNKKFDKNADLETVARKTVGYSGADLENLLNEAAIMAAKDERSVISQSDLIESHLKVKLGRQKRNKRTEDDIKRVAYHEAGHAVVAKLTPGAHPVEKISIISRGDSGGVTVTIPEEEETMTKKSQLYAKITTLVSGKVAEELFMEEMTTGASSDIKYATELARLMVQKFGMNERLGFVSYGNIEDSSYLGFQYNSSKEYSEKTAEMIDEEVRKIMEKAQKSSKRILTDNKALVEKLVSLLIENEEVDRKEFDSLFE